MQVRKKFRRLKRFAYLGAITGTVITVRRQRSRRAAGPAEVGAPATWPPLRPSSESPVAHVDDPLGGASTESIAANVPLVATSPEAPVGDEPVAAEGALATDAPSAPDTVTESSSDTDTDIGQSWVEPNEGACPLSHPVKANANSGIYHVPGGRFYERTQAERCYVDAAAAEADGYRAAKDR